MSRRPYVRPMKRTWFMDHPYYRNYMIRESSSIVDGLYCLNLFDGLIQLTRGEVAWNSWVAFQAHPLMILFAIVTLGLTIYHSVTYFDMTPRVLPQQIRKMVKGSVISMLMYVGLVICSLVIVAASVVGL